MQIKKGDKVKVIAGDEKGKEGVISRVLPNLNKVLIEGINLKKRHKKSRKDGEKGTIIEMATPIHVSNVSRVEKVEKKDKVKKVEKGNKSTSA